MHMAEPFWQKNRIREFHLGGWEEGVSCAYHWKKLGRFERKKRFFWYPKRSVMYQPFGGA